MSETKELVAEEIYDAIGSWGDISFAGLANRWPDFFEHGNLEICWPGDVGKNIVLWQGVTGDGLIILNILRELGVRLHACHPMVYMIDGAALNLPLARSIRDYKARRWLPVLLKRVAT